jgi:CubicO group peptidase (beta-lactamase class C family)
MCFWMGVLALLPIDLFAQVPDFVKTEGITSRLHQAQIGRITFMGKPIPIESYHESDFLSAFEVTPKSDLNIRTFLGNSLTNYLHGLAPTLTAEELVQKGNFQFTFKVDDVVVYTENLVPGAGSPMVKNEKTVFRVPLISTTNEDSWGRFLWNRFMMNGGQEALSGDMHLLRIELRPYIALPEVKVGELMAKGQIEIKLATKKVNPKDVAIQPLRSTKEIPASKTGFDRARIEALNTKIAEGSFKNITSIVVLRNDSLVLEEYFNGASPKTLHDTRSVGKSLTSILMGFALRDGLLKSTDVTLGELYPLAQYAHYSLAKANITLAQLLTMRSGLAGSDMDPESPGNEEKMYVSPDWVRFALDLPLADSTNSFPQWNYLTAGVVVLGDILNRVVPGGLEKYADAQLFGPLGIHHYKWQYTPQKVVNTAGGIRMRSIDLAKIGRYCAGALDSSWMQRCLTPQVAFSDREGYGYLFWNKTFRVNGRDYAASYASGNGGNKIFVFPAEGLVIVVTATAFGEGYAHSQVDRMLEGYLLGGI